MTGRERIILAALFLSAILAALLLAVAADRLCPVELPGQGCPDARRNVVVILILAAVALGLLVAPFAFLAEFLARRRIVYRGAWWRAGRRGALAGALLATLGSLRLGDALTVPVIIFGVVMTVVIERFLAARDR